MAQDFPYSKSEVNKAGIELCGIERPEQSLDEIRHHVAVANAWRASHGPPLASVVSSLRSFATTTGVHAAIAQRHKRLRRIMGKIYRSDGSTRLARMEDIGGARVIFANIDDLRRFEAHIEKKWGDNIKRRRDYIEEPKSTGYRAVHIVVERQERRIEVQLRTTSMHDWADAVEALGRSRQQELKVGEGPAEILEFLAVVAERNSVDESGEEPTVDLLSRFSETREAMLAYIGQQQSEGEV